MKKPSFINLRTIPQVIIAVIIGITSIISSLLISKVINNYLLDNEGKFIPMMVQKHFARHVGDPEILRRYVNADAQKLFTDFSDDLKFSSQVIRVDIYNISSVRIWTDWKEGVINIGETEDEGQTMNAALAGETARKRITINDRALHQEDIDMFRTIQARVFDKIFVPIFGKDGKVAGVVEVSFNQTEFLNFLGQINGTIFIFSSLEIVLIVLVLYFAFSRVTRTLKRQSAVIDEHAKNLEATVSARTAELQASEQKYRAITEHASATILSANVLGEIHYMNPGGLKFLGFSSLEEAQKTPMKSLCENPQERDAFVARFKKSAHVNDMELHWRTRRGEARVVLASATRLGDEIIGTAIDITERKRMEEALHENERLLEESQHIGGLGTYVLDVLSGLWTSSEVLDGIFGIDETYVRTVEGWSNLIAPGDRKMMTDYFVNEVLGKGQPFNKEYRVVRQNDKAERWVHGKGKMEFNIEGRPIKMHGTIQDITEIKRTSEENARIVKVLVDRELRMIELKKKLAEATVAPRKEESKNGNKKFPRKA